VRSLINSSFGLLFAVAAFFFISHLVAQQFVVTTAGMEPGLRVGERLLISKMSYHFKEPDRGDIIFYSSPHGNSTQLKRVVGLPGDTVEINNQSLYINGVQLLEPYVKYPAAYILLPYQVPFDHYFVLDDNRTYASDSHTDWTVHREEVLGRAWILTWPPEKWGTVNNYPIETQLLVSETR
jgi:signal peptidase I